MGLFGGTKQSQATSGALSGSGEFRPTNRISIGNSFLPDLTDPQQLGGAVLLVLIGYWAWKRFK